MKRLVREEGTDVVARLLGRARAATCRFTEIEISSALARRHREGDLSAAARDTAVADLREELARMDVIELAPAVVAEVHVLLARHALRAGDAVQLAAASVLRDRSGEVVEFVSWDERLCAAARAEGFTTRP